MKFVKIEEAQTTQKQEEEKNELLVEQRSEEDSIHRRTVRQQIVNSIWGSESELTKAAYELVNNAASDELEEGISIDVNG